MSIEIKGLSHTYMPGSPFQSTAVRDVTLTIKDGEFVGLIGHTGSGKSTLIQHLNGLLKPTHGRVVVDGIDISEKGRQLKEVRRIVGLVFQYPEYQLFEETVEKDIAFGPRNLGLSEAETAQRVREACAMVGISYEEVAARSPFELSGGQKRRVAIAGVLAMRPRVLVLDEPTAGLDPRGREEILSFVKETHTQMGGTVIMVSHSMDDVARLAQRIVVMNRGTVALDGPPEAVFSKGAQLEEMGLGLPEAVRLKEKLIACGWPLSAGLYKKEDIQSEILRIAGKEGAHA